MNKFLDYLATVIVVLTMIAVPVFLAIFAYAWPEFRLVLTFVVGIILISWAFSRVW